MLKETITVNFQGKWGPNVNGTFYSIDQKSGVKAEQFEKGKTYDVLVSVSKSGKKYIHQIVGNGDEQAVYDDTKSPPVKAGDDKILEVIKKERKETDWDGIARGKVACAMFEAALTSPGLAMYATSKEEYVKLVKEAAEVGIEFTWKHQKGA